MKVISSKKYYSVYWYPTIFHQEKEHRTVQPEPIDISDESTAHEYYLFIEEEKDPHRKDVYNIHYYLSKNRKSLQEIKLDKKCISFVFQYIKHSRNGFVVYSYDRDALLKAFWDQYGQQGSS